MNPLRSPNHRPPHRRPPNGRPDAHRQRQNGSAGNAYRNYERYLALAREAGLSGDRVEMENWYQHAEHYFRVMNDRGWYGGRRSDSCSARRSW
jgi:uncharacterized protein DUF4167